MSQGLKNVVLNFVDKNTELLKIFLEENNISLRSVNDSWREEKIIGIVIDQSTKSINEFINENDLISVPLISIDPFDEIYDLFQNTGCTVLSLKKLQENREKEKWLKILLRNEKSIHLDEGDGNDFEVVNSFHLTNHFAMGVYLDTLSAFAFDHHYDFVKLRSFCHYITSYCHLLRQNRFLSYPIDMEYGVNSKNINIRFSCRVQSFSNDLLIQHFKGDKEAFNSSESLLFHALNSVDHLEVIYIENSKTLMITGESERYSPLKESNPTLSLSALPRVSGNVGGERSMLKVFDLYEKSKLDELNKKEINSQNINEIINNEVDEKLNKKIEEGLGSEIKEQAMVEIAKDDSRRAKEEIEREIKKEVYSNNIFKDEAILIEGKKEEITEEIQRVLGEGGGSEDSIQRISDKVGVSSHLAEATFADMMESLFEAQRLSFGHGEKEAAELVENSIKDEMSKISVDSILNNKVKEKISIVSSSDIEDRVEEIKKLKTDEEKEEELKERENRLREAERRKIREEVEEDYFGEILQVEHRELPKALVKVAGKKFSKDNDEKSENENSFEEIVISASTEIEEEALLIKDNSFEEEEVVVVRDLFIEMMIDYFDQVAEIEREELPLIYKQISKNIAKFCLIKDEEFVEEILNHVKSFFTDNFLGILSSSEAQKLELARDLKVLIKEIMPEEFHVKLDKENANNINLSERQFVESLGHQDKMELLNEQSSLNHSNLKKKQPSDGDAESWRNKYIQAVSEKSGSNKLLKNVENDNHQLKLKLEHEKKKNQRLENEILKSKKILNKDQLKNEMLQLKSESTAKDRVISNLESQISDKEKKIQFHKKEILAARAAHEAELESKIKETKMSFEKKMDFKPDPSPRKEVVRNEVKAAIVPKEFLAKLSTLERKNKEVNQQLAKAKEKILHQANSITKEKKDASADKKLDFLEKKIRKSSELLAVAQGQNTDLKKQNSKMKTETKGLQNKIRLLSQELERMKKRQAS